MAHCFSLWPWLLLLLLMQPLSAQEDGLAFSARAMRQQPQQPPREAHIVVSHQGVRIEYERNGLPVVEIYNLEHKRAWLLMPEQRIFQEYKMPDNLSSSILMGNHDRNPCAGMPQAQCRPLGEEMIAGRYVIKWQMTLMEQERALHSLHWIEQEEYMPLKQIWSDGMVSEMRFIGKEKRNSRETQKWQSISTSPEGSVQISTIWYDPELKIAIREELPGGYVRELDGINVGAQPEALFEIPAGFIKIDVPEDRTVRQMTPGTTATDGLPWHRQ